MDAGALGLVAAAVGLGFLHTVLGPDHFLPFIMLARARSWSVTRTLVITLLCGIGHVASSLALGGIGLAVGWGVGEVEGLEGSRGEIAAWALVAFGLAYALWGLRRGLRRRSGMELHAHGGHVHLHREGHGVHRHTTDPAADSRTTFWVLFIIFVLGPCEPLIPLFLVPASTGDWTLAAITGGAFSLATVATMVTVVALGVLGLRQVRFRFLERWSETLAGLVIAASGCAILFLGL